MSKKATRRALLSSALSLLLCASMLVGTTFAWFTDSVTSTGNIIKSGTLDVGMYWADGTKAVPTVDTDWTDASTGAIFDYDLWEPGYTEVRHIKITNEGTLALKYQLAIRPTGTVSELADVIDVYFVDPAVQVADRTDLADANKAGTLTQILAGMPANASGKLEATKEATVTIALKMQETAGNEYQDMALASDFAVVLMATQLTAENDSFDDQYDAESKYDADVWDGLKVETPAADTEGVYRISTAAQLIGMMEDSQYPNCNKYQNVVLENNIDLAGQTVPGFGDGSGFFDGIFDGQGYTISNFTIDATDRTYYAGLFNQVSQYSGENTVIKNLTVANATISGTGQVGAIVGGMNGNTVVDNCKAIDCTLMGVKKVGAVVGYTAGGTVTNNYAKDCIVLYSEKEGGEILGYENTGSTVNNNTFDNVVVRNGGIIADSAELSDALKNDAMVYLDEGEYTLPSLSGKEGITIIGGEGVVVGGENAATGFGANFGKDTTIKDVTFSGTSNGVRWSYANGGTSTFDNCTFAGDSTYGFHIDESNGATFIFNNCTFSGFNAFAGDLTKVVFNNCTFLNNGSYGHTNIWSVAEFNGCTWGDETSVAGGKLFFDGVEESYHHEFIGSAETLFAFAKSVNEGDDSWAGQKVLLVDDIDLAGQAWIPVGQTGATQFMGIFDGQGYTISNLTIDSSAQTGANYSSGLFGWLNKATVENVNVEHATVTGNHNVAVIAGYLETAGCTVSNCHVTDATVVAKHANGDACGDKAGVVVGHAGNAGVLVEKCSAANSTVTAGRDAGQVVGAAKTANVVDCTATNVTVTAGGDCTGANVNNAVIGRTL